MLSQRVTDGDRSSCVSVVGIDLGTTNTVVACVRSGKVHVLADEHGARLLPSVVSFHPNGEVLVGGAAKARRVIDPRNTVYSHKRLIGRSWCSPEIAQAKSRFAFELKEGPGQGPLIRARGQDYTLPEISAFVLKRTRQIAEAALGGPVERAVITVPAHFNELQRASTKVAGRVSGLEVLRILNEPTAAALAYGLGRTGNERVAVYDFGGGTFDCTLLDLNGNVFEVLATAGDSFLGGDDIDNLIAERMAETYLKQHRYDPRTDPSMLERLKTTAEELKMVLSTAETHTVVLKEFGHGGGGSAINYVFTMTRRDLDHMVTPLIDRSFKVTQDALALARLSPTSFDKVILVGGSTRIPLIRKRVEAVFGAPPLDRVNPDEVVAIGAAIQAAALTEGVRKRSIPAPPGVIGQKPRTFPGLNSEENTQTGMVESPNMANRPGAAFGSEPPSFGFHPGSAPPPPTKSGPPGVGVSGARSNSTQVGGPRKITNPGVAPQTQPLGARPPQAAPPSAAHDDDPSIASFPDLQAPTPFEWFPSSGPGAARSGPAGSERSFGGNTVTATGVEQNTMTAAVDPSGGFGAIDEPPSLMSMPSASVPSFPSMTGSSSPQMPSPIGEPESFAAAVPGKFGEVRDLSLISTTGLAAPPGAPPPGGKFGEIRDLSLISTTGLAAPPGAPPPGGKFGEVRDLSLISSTGVSSPSPITGGGGRESADFGFGHVSDLSLISTSGAMAEAEGIGQARKDLLENFEDETEANVIDGKGGTMNLDPTANPGARSPAALQGHDDSADLPALAQPTDLPSVAGGRGKRPEIRKPGQLGMQAGGGASMAGKPPPKMAPQPFGKMEKIGAEDSPPSRTAALQAKPPPPAPSSAARGPGPQPARTAAMPARQPPPLATTAPLNPPSPASARGGPGATTPFGSAPPGAMGPPGFAPAGPPPFPSAPPPATAQFGGFGGSQPPQPYASQPPPGYAPPGASQPPIFGAYPSAPPDAPLDVNAMGVGFDPNMSAGAPGMGQHIGYQTPVLVDVTPRGLVVETAGGYTDTIIPRNSKIPCERTRRFATGRDMQTSVRVRVGQGEGNMFNQNTFLGEVELSGLRPAPRGEVVVAVTFEVDADGTLRIRARDVQTGQEARATLQLIGVADESSVVMMINRFAQQPVVGSETPGGPTH
jgi:molecular chaperone DnaK